MQDTPQHIKELQLKIWLAKPPMERLRQFLIDNEQFYLMIEGAKKSLPFNTENKDLNKLK